MTGPVELALFRAHRQRQLRFFPNENRKEPPLESPPPPLQRARPLTLRQQLYFSAIPCRRRKCPPPIAEIILFVSMRTGVDIATIKALRRYKSASLARHYVMYLARQVTSLSLPEIGRRIGGRDHTSVLHGVRNIENLRARDSALDRMLADWQCYLESEQ